MAPPHKAPNLGSGKTKWHWDAILPHDEFDLPGNFPVARLRHDTLVNYAQT
jgi:hypothetical protein